MNEASAIDFYFDFSSPYSYLLSEKIDTLAGHFGRKVRWHPILLGVVFQHLGGKAPAEIPPKRDYMRHDVLRSARFLGVPFQWPQRFPIPTQAAARSYYWLHGQDCTLARRFAHATFRAMFMEDRDISSPDAVLDIGASLDIDRAALTNAIAAPEMKDKLKLACADAITKGVFGAPWVIIDGEPFWGVDRLPQMEELLTKGKI